MNETRIGLGLLALVSASCGPQDGDHLEVGTSTRAAIVEYELVASDTHANQFFGANVSISGTWAVVGSSEGAYVYRNPGSGWAQYTKLTISGVTSYGQVAISGGVILMTTNRGVEVFRNIAGVWTWHSTLTTPNGIGPTAVNGNTVVIGTPYDGEGSAHIFELINGVWTYIVKLTPDEEPGILAGSFGSSVAVWGTTVMIGGETNMHPNYMTGAVFVYGRVNGVWTFQQKLNSEAGQSEEFFGHTVSLENNTAVITKNVWWTAGAEVWVRSGSTWTRQTTLLGTEWTVGVAAAVSLNDVVIGATIYDLYTYELHERVYTYKNVMGVWYQTGNLQGADTAPGQSDFYGACVAISNRVALACANRHDHNGLTDSGSAYLYTGL